MIPYEWSCDGVLLLLQCATALCWHLLMLLLTHKRHHAQLERNRLASAAKQPALRAWEASFKPPAQPWAPGACQPLARRVSPECAQSCVKLNQLLEAFLVTMLREPCPWVVLRTTINWTLTGC